MDPSQWGYASRLAANAAAASSSGITERNILSHYLMTPAQRDAARQYSLDTARLQSLGLGAPTPASGAQQAVRDQLGLEAVMTARRSRHAAIQAALAPDGTTAARHQDDLKLKIPPRSAPLPSMENVELDNIETPHPHDVLCGRGSSVNHHAGNENFRELVQSLKVQYVMCNKLEKVALAEDIVRAVRSQNPPGRFLQFNVKKKTWFDIGTRAREKTAQALREGAPDIRQNLDEAPLKHDKIHSARRMLPLHSRDPRVLTEQRSSNSFSPPSSVGPLDTAASMNRSLFAAPPLSATTASVLHGFHAQSRDELAAASPARAASLNSSGHSGQSRYDATAKQLAAEIMAAHVRERQEAKAAQKAAAKQATDARSTSVPMEEQVPTNPRLFAPLGQLPGNLSAPNHHSWDAGLNTILPGSLGRGRNLPLALTLQRLEQQQLDREKLELANAMAQHQSLAACILEQEQQSLTSQEVHQVSSSLRDDLVHRLVLAETLAQRTVQGTLTEAMKAQEKRLGLYVDAGLLGIDLGDMAERQAGGQSEESIVEEYYENLKLKRPDDGRASGPAHKKFKVGTASVNGHPQESDIQDTLGAVGAMIRLRTQGANGAGSETETDDSD